ncbi:hypothetical protein SUGI_1037010 [Cryptomeria japonica]|nr:hypothetical protein SUGI_1037010 [Cryptomeria japonica]
MASMTVIMADDHSKIQGKTLPLATLFETDNSVIELPIVGQNDLCALPYSSGTTGASKGICCATLHNKGKVVVMSRFDLCLFMDVLINCGINFVPIVLPIMLALVKNPIVEEYDLSGLQLKAIMTAAAPLAPDL